jgi:hypothetical protein
LRPPADGFGLPVPRNATSNGLRARRANMHGFVEDRATKSAGVRGGAWEGELEGARVVPWRTVRGCHEDLLSASCLGWRWADGKRSRQRRASWRRQIVTNPDSVDSRPFGRN